MCVLNGWMDGFGVGWRGEEGGRGAPGWRKGRWSSTGGGTGDGAAQGEKWTRGHEPGKALLYMLRGPSLDTGTSPITFLDREVRSVPDCSLLGYVGLVAPLSEGENSKGLHGTVRRTSLHETCRTRRELRFPPRDAIEFSLQRLLLRI